MPSAITWFACRGPRRSPERKTETTRRPEATGMIKFLAHLLISAAAVYLAQWLSRWLITSGLTSTELVTVNDFLAAIVFALVLGVLNAIVRPILLLLTCPITLLTLGLFVLVINAVVFYIAALLVPSVRVDGFLGAFFGSLVVTVCSTVADQLLVDKSD